MEQRHSKEHFTAWRELASRCRTAGFVYLLAAPIVLVNTPSFAARPFVSGFVMIAFVTLTWVRSRHAIRMMKTAGRIPFSLKVKFDRLASLNGLLWGVFAASATFTSEGWRSWLVLFITGLICAGAVSSMTPDFRVFWVFSGLAFLPSILVLLVFPTEQTLAIGCLCLGFWGLSIWMGWNQNRTYWHSLRTNRSQMEELASARERLELVVSGSNLGAFDWILENETVFLDSKVADILDYPQEMFNPYTGKLDGLVFADDIPRLVSSLIEHLKDPSSPLCDIELRLCDSSGEAHWFKFRGRVVQRDKRGRATRMAGTYEDITRQKQAEAALVELQRRVEQAEKLKTLGVLAGGLAHDFNNLLSAFVGNLELAEEALEDASPAAEFLVQAKQSALDASGLCNQLLAYAGKGKFVIETFCPNRLLQDMTHLLRVTVGRDLELRLDLLDGIPSVDGDISQIRQVLLNLITNAAESMEGMSGEISLKTFLLSSDDVSSRHPDLKPSDYVCFEVSDQGCGMSQETLDKIFDPFFSTKFTGRGLGLASVLGIARSHHGEISARSELGQGTTFQLLLPASTALAEVPVEPELTVGQAYPTQILLVDDELSIRKIVKHMLSKAGHEVVLAEDGEVALERLAECGDEIALVILDMTMPKKNGYETLKEIRQTWPDLPVLLSSGFSEDAVLKKAGAEIQGFLKKPFTRAQLLAEVSRIQSL